jgi:cytochrome c peroxidase
MNPRLRNGMLATAAAGILLLPAVRTRAQQGQPVVPNLAGFADATGVLRTYAQSGNIDLTNPFFQALGTNGRACATCHQPSDAMGLSAAHAQLRFDQSQGLEPLFRTNDGSNCDHNIDTSTLQGRRAAYSLMRTRAVLRVSIPVPAARDFEVVSVVNPYGCSETNVISMYRRPLPGSGLKFLSAVMWDGRESSSETGTTPITFGNYPQSLAADLAHQALDATMGHAQGIALTAAQQQSIVALEMGLSSAQAEDRSAGNLSAMGATGGPLAMSQQGFYIGVNDPVGLDPNNPVPLHFNTRVFNLYDGWQEHGNPHMQAIARGQQIFNTRTFTITGVAGLNGATFSNGVTAPQSIVSTCGICHDTPNVGNHSVAAALNIGVADPTGGANVLDVSYLPVVTICQKPNLTTCVQTTDPGRAMITGHFADVGKFKGPELRGLAARAPYFHNGSAQSLDDVVTFYDSRFHIGLTAQEKSDLVAFLSAL